MITGLIIRTVARVTLPGTAADFETLDRRTVGAFDSAVFQTPMTAVVFGCKATTLKVTGCANGISASRQQQ